MADIFHSAVSWGYQSSNTQLTLDIPGLNMNTTTPGHGFLVVIYSFVRSTVFNGGEAGNPLGTQGANTDTEFFLHKSLHGAGSIGHLALYYKIATATETTVTFEWTTSSEVLWSIHLLTHNYVSQDLWMDEVGFGQGTGVNYTNLTISECNPYNWLDINTAFMLLTAGNNWPGTRASGDFNGNTGVFQNDDDPGEGYSMRGYSSWQSLDKTLDPQVDNVAGPIVMASPADWINLVAAFQVQPLAPGDLDPTAGQSTTFITPNKFKPVNWRGADLL